MEGRNLIEWRVCQLEQQHERMRNSLDELTQSVQDLVMEFKVSKRFIGALVVLVGVLQPLLKHIIE